MKKLLFTLITGIITLTAAAQIPNYVPTNGLVGWWPFNGNANDESGNGNNGTVNGATLTTDRFGVANKAYSFNGNNFIAVSHNTSFNMTQSTWNVWVRKSSNTSGNGMYIFGKRDNSQHHITFCSGNTGNCQIGWASAQSIGINGGNIVGSWHMLTITYNQALANSNVSFYYDGILQGTSTIQPFTFVNGDLRFGIEVNNSYWQGFNGFIDDALVYNRVLSICEIQDLFNTQLNSASGISAGPDQTVCNGASVVLNGNGGSNYSWNNNIQDGVIFIPNGTTTFTVTGINGNGCQGSDQVVITINPLPTVSGGPDQELCEGQSTLLFGTGASNYQWSNNVQNGVGFVPTATTSYVLTGTDANGCVGTDTVIVTVNEASSSTQTQTALDSYTWPVNGQTYTQSGQYTDTLLNAAGCDSIVTLDLTLSFTGIDEINLNPTKKLVKITDLNGKEIPFKKNTVLLFIYEDGTVERIYEVE